MLMCKFGPGCGSGTVPAGLPQGETEGFYLMCRSSVSTSNVFCRKKLVGVSCKDQLLVIVLMIL